LVLFAALDVLVSAFGLYSKSVERIHHQIKKKKRKLPIILKIDRPSKKE
jgi:hypothetical protein